MLRASSENEEASEILFAERAKTGDKSTIDLLRNRASNNE